MHGRGRLTAGAGRHGSKPSAGITEVTSKLMKEAEHGRNTS